MIGVGLRPVQEKRVRIDLLPDERAPQPRVRRRWSVAGRGDVTLLISIAAHGISAIPAMEAVDAIGPRCARHSTRRELSVDSHLAEFGPSVLVDHVADDQRG